jgi:putative ABC transport system substrate-binding protein
VKRRDFIAGSASAALLACATANAQQRSLPVIGLLDHGWPGRFTEELGRGLAESGFLAGRDFRAEHSGWSARGYSAEHLAQYAAALVQRRVAVILAFSNQAARVAKTVTDTTPIVFLADEAVVPDLVDRPARVGGNLTGAAILDAKLVATRIEIVRELVPAANLVVLVTDPTNMPAHDVEVREAQAIADARGLALSVIRWSGEGGLEPALAELPRDRNAVLVFGGGLPFHGRSAQLAHLAVYYRIPAIHGFRGAADEGGLLSFGARLEGGGYLMGLHAARILKGDRPAELPVGRITRTELVINERPAKTLGLPIPATLLARADEVIR